MTESSTIMPSTTISAASDTVFSGMSVRNIIASAIAVHTGTAELAISADFNGKSSSITAMTTSMEITRSRRKDHTELPTTLGWSVILLSVTLSGSPASNSAITLSTSFPKLTMSLSGLISIENITAGVPLYSARELGAAWRLSTVAMSRRRSTSPSGELYTILLYNCSSVDTVPGTCIGEFA